MQSEIQLMHRMTDGDSSAFAELYDLHAPKVLGFLVRLLPTRSDADDVLQEVFLQVWKTAGRYDDRRGNPRAWLFMMARSRAMDCLRKLKPSVPIEQQSEPAYSENATGELERKELTVQVRHALFQLPKEQREVISLSFYDGLAHKDIAEQLSIPLGTAKTRIRLGMKRMRDLLVHGAAEQTSSTGRLPR